MELSTKLLLPCTCKSVGATKLDWMILVVRFWFRYAVPISPAHHGRLKVWEVRYTRKWWTFDRTISKRSDKYFKSSESKKTVLP